jgi:hypothetical protein
MSAYEGNPDWPAHFPTGHVVAKFLASTGIPEVGTITFTPRAPVMVVTSDAVIVTAETTTVTLDAHGAIDVELPATDSDNVRPLNFTYEVTENFGSQRSYDIYVPTGVDTNLLDVSPVQPSIGLMQYFGPPGPAADVIDGGAP